MPTLFKNPNQNLEFQIPSEGEVVVTSNDPSTYFLRRGSKLFELAAGALPGVTPTQLTSNVQELERAGLTRAPYGQIAGTSFYGSTGIGLSQLQSMFRSAIPQPTAPTTAPLGGRGSVPTPELFVQQPSALSSLERTNQLLLASSKDPLGLPYSPVKSITTQDLKTQPTATFTQPTIPPPFNVAGLNTQASPADLIQKTPEQEELQKDIDQFKLDNAA